MRGLNEKIERCPDHGFIFISMNTTMRADSGYVEKCPLRVCPHGNLRMRSREIPKRNVIEFARRHYLENLGNR